MKTYFSDKLILSKISKAEMMTIINEVEVLLDHRKIAKHVIKGETYYLIEMKLCHNWQVVRFV